MVWAESQRPCTDVAVTVAVNPTPTASADLLGYRVTAGHSHGPPTAFDAQRNAHQTYYVLAGETPVLVHNSNCPGLFKGDGLSHTLERHDFGSPGTQGKSAFSEDLTVDDVCDLICETASMPGKKNVGTDPVTGLPRDGTVHEKTYPYPVGQSADGAWLNGVRVIRNPDGTLRTAYPI
jgi:hypothetical protein